MNLARLGNKYLADTEPWKLIKTDKERVGTILHVSLQLTANLAILCFPFLPFTSEKLFGFLNLEPLKWNEAGRSDLLQKGHQINEAGLLFSKVEDKEIEHQLNKLIQNRKDNEMAGIEVMEAKDEISFEEFGKTDIRVSTILEAEKVPKTKKLIKMKVNTGIDTRTIVSGIAEYFSPEELPGKKVCVLVNLAPRRIKGIDSQGMVLLSENADGTLYFVEPSKEAENGAPVN